MKPFSHGAMAWMFSWDLVRQLDIRFTSVDDEANFVEHLAQKRRLQTLVSSISVIAVWLYSELRFLAQRADAGAEDDAVGLHSWLTFGGCFAWLLAAVVTARPKSKFCTFNHEWIWVPLASFCCALVVQPRPYEVGPSRLGIASAAVSATAMLPLRSAVSWLVYAVAVVAFALGSQDKVGAADSVALVLVAISLYHAGWYCESCSRIAVDSECGKLVVEDLVSDDEESKPVTKEATEAPDYAILRIGGDLTILPCSLQEQRYFGADLAGKSLLDYLSPEDHHSFLLLLHSELWHLRSIIVRIKCASSQESLRIRLFQTGAQPPWLVFFSAVDSCTHAPQGLPSVPDDPPCKSTGVEVQIGRDSIPEHWDGPESLSLSMASGPRLPRRSPSLRSVRSIRSDQDQTSPRLPLASDVPGSPSLRIPGLNTGAEASHSVFSLSACSWSFSTDGYKAQAQVRSLSDGQTQTELVWNDLGWQCRNCQKPPRPPQPPSEALQPTLSPRVMGKAGRNVGAFQGSCNSYQAHMSPEERRNDQLLRMQGCWVLCNGPSKMVGWLHGLLPQ